MFFVKNMSLNLKMYVCPRTNTLLGKNESKIRRNSLPFVNRKYLKLILYTSFNLYNFFYFKLHVSIKGGI